MHQLIDCSECTGLLRADSERCPHCGVAQQVGARRNWLVAVGFGALAACGVGMHDAVVEGGPDGGDAAYLVGADAYGAPPFQDGSYTVSTDAYGLPPFFDGGEHIAEPDGGDGGTDAGE